MFKGVLIVLDKERHLRMTLNGMIKFQELTGINLLERADFSNAGPDIVRALLYCSLLHEDPALKLETVGDLVDRGDIVTVISKLTEMWLNSSPEGKEDADPKQ